MTKITVYTRQLCGFCGAAKQLLSSQNYKYEEINLDDDPELMEKVMLKSGQRTMPQIFVGDYSVGGFRELYKLMNDGEFDDLVKNDLSSTY